MEAGEFENILRRVVREELAALLQLGPVTARPEVAERRELPARPEGAHPFDMTDAELTFAERLLPEAERQILRLRVMAFRLERKGNRTSAQRMRRRADNMEAQLRKVV
jgi:hypothetical protein